MHIGHLNVNGIRSKFAQIEVMLNSKDNDIAIFGVTESKLGPNQPDAFFNIDIQKDTSKKLQPYQNIMAMKA